MDFFSGEKIRKIDNGPMESWTIAFSPDSKHIISGAQNGKVHFFDTETGQKTQQMDTRGKFVLSIAYVRNYKQLSRNQTQPKNLIICQGF